MNLISSAQPFRVEKSNASMWTKPAMCPHSSQCISGTVLIEMPFFFSFLKLPIFSCDNK